MNLSMHPSPEAADIMNSIRRLVRALRLFSRESEKRAGLSAAQFFVLQRLQDGKPASINELARRTMTDISSVSVVADRLVGKKLLERRKSLQDARVREIRLSPTGKLLLRQTPDPLQARLVRAIEKIRPEKRRALNSSLQLLLKEAGLEGELPALMFEGEAA